MTRDEWWLPWTDEHLLEYEQQLLDDEVAGNDTWHLRELVLDEMRRRGMI